MMQPASSVAQELLGSAGTPGAVASGHSVGRPCGLETHFGTRSAVPFQPCHSSLPIGSQYGRKCSASLGPIGARFFCDVVSVAPSGRPTICDGSNPIYGHRWMAVIRFSSPGCLALIRWVNNISTRSPIPRRQICKTYCSMAGGARHFWSTELGRLVVSPRSQGLARARAFGLAHGLPFTPSNAGVERHRDSAMEHASGPSPSDLPGARMRGDGGDPVTWTSLL